MAADAQADGVTAAGVVEHMRHHGVLAGITGPGSCVVSPPPAPILAGRDRAAGQRAGARARLRLVEARDAQNSTPDSRPGVGGTALGRLEFLREVRDIAKRSPHQAARTRSGRRIPRADGATGRLTRNPIPLSPTCRSTSLVPPDRRPSLNHPRAGRGRRAALGSPPTRRAGPSPRVPATEPGQMHPATHVCHS